MKYLALIIALAFLPASQAADRFTNNYNVRVLQGSGSAIRGVGATRVSKYVQGYYALGLWDVTTEMLTLRSAQNAGTGTVVYGLKGAHTGSMINGPTWGTTGITFDGSDDVIEVNSSNSIFQNVGAGWIAACAIDNNIAGGGATHQVVAASTNTGNALLNTVTRSATVYGSLGRRLAADSVVMSTTSPLNLNRMWLEGRADWVGAGTLQTVIDGSALSATGFSSGAGLTANLASSAPIRIGGTGASNGIPGVVSCVIISTNLPSLALAERVRNLYKNTMGQNLGLP